MFKLEFNIPKSPLLINLENRIISIGSCFSDNIGDKLSQNKFRISSNPFGTLFNPHSIFRILSPEMDTENIVENQSVYYHWGAHGEASSLDKNELKKSISAKHQNLQSELKQTDWLIITLGTSLVYEYIPTGQIVANCHKVPQKEFKKRLLTTEEIIFDYQQTLSSIRKENPNLKVILTVSPVRHTKEGLSENNVSKSILLQAVSRIVSEDKKSFYFPSYEIMIDELRDYRFYKADMVHPSDQAIDYIWRKFKKSFLDTETEEFVDDWSKIISSINHKPFHINSKAHQSFVRNLIVKVEKYSTRVNVDDELKSLRNQLTS